MNRPIDDETATSGQSGPPIKLIAFVAVAALAVVFVFQNRERHRIDFLFFEISTRTWTALTTALVLGVVLDRLFISWWRRSRNRRNER
ncbi:MAG TPA: hypothetical protein VFV63_16830 [Ilumatobacteraceae bacterium]|nr:hypothetical protein [Ilumatobacteraceae bacterium]